MTDIVERLRQRPWRSAAENDYEAKERRQREREEGADEITALRAENERLKTCGIAEVAAHNPSVMGYMRHWEGRTLKAEAEVERLTSLLERAVSRGCNHCMPVIGPIRKELEGE